MKKPSKKKATTPRVKAVAKSKAPIAPSANPTTVSGPHRVDNMAAQGDVLFRRVASIPSTATEVKAKGPIVVAHSETGHNHSIDDVSGAKLFRVENDPLVSYLRVEGAPNIGGGSGPKFNGAIVTHHRPHDTHAPLLLTPGSWEVKRQREYVPGGWRRVED